MKTLTNLQAFARATMLAAAAALPAAPAAAWDAPTRLDDSASFASSLGAAQDGKGKIVVVWRHWDGMQDELWSSQKPAGGPFTAGVRISGDGPVNSFDLAANRKGMFAAVWSEHDGFSKRIYSADLLPKETAFGLKTPISAASEDRKYPQVAIDKKGGTVAAWIADSGPGVEVAVRPAKESFLAAELIAPTHEASSLRVGTSDDGSAVVSWARWNGMTNETHAAVRRPKLDFEPVQLVSDPMDNGYSPILTVHPRGGASIFYGTSEAMLQPGAALFDAPVAFQQILAPSFRYDKKGNLYAFWTKFAPANKAVFAVRPAGSDTFGPEIEFGDGVDDASAGDVAVDGKGNVRVVWTQFVTGYGTIVRTAYQPAGGVFSAPEDVTDFDDSAFAKRVFLDKKGNSTVLWTDGLGGIWATSQTN